MSKNKLGQFTSQKAISVKVAKRLQSAAKNLNTNIMPIIRDELEQTLRSEIYKSYRPATDHSNPNVRPYIHTGLLISSVYAEIKEDTIQAEIDDKVYPNGKTASEVYNYLKFGTTDDPNNDIYIYFNNGLQFSTYISQSPHNFEARTREHMKEYLNILKTDIKTNPEKYIH